MTIRVQNLHKQFGNKVLFSNLSFEIESGKITGIFGSSGSGKTTLLNIIGLIEPAEGTVEFDGKPVQSKKKINRMLSEKISFVFQNYGLVEHMTVLENLKLMKCMDRQEVRGEVGRALEKMGLGGFEGRKVFELSGGEQQRVALTKVILKNPEIILADEPTASLDEQNKQLVMSLFRDFAGNGKTVVIVSHDPWVIRQCDEVINLDEYIHRGQLIGGKQ